MYMQNKSEVKRTIGLFTATSIVIANIIGTGIFTTSGLMAAELPSPIWVLGCWLFGGVLAMAGALCYAELATRMPEEGAEYVYLKRLYHPVLGFLTGWTSFFAGFSAPIAGSALAFVAYIFAGMNPALTSTNDSSIIIIKKLIAVLIILIFTLLHYGGIRHGARVQIFLTVIKIMIVSGLAGTGVVFGSGSWTHFTADVSDSFSAHGLGTAMMLVMFSYSGWNASAYIAGELKNPRKTLPVSLITGTGIVILIYLSVNIFLFQAAPYSELRGGVTVVERATVFSFGDWTGNLLSVLIAIALLSSLSAFIIIGPRVYFAMARDRLFFSFADQVHSRFGVPSRSILIQGIMAIAMVLIGTFEQLVLYIGFALNIFPWLAIAGIFIARKRQIGEAVVVNVYGYPVIPIFYLISSLVLMIIAFLGRPVESTAAIVTVLIGIPIYYLWSIKYEQ